MSADLLAEFGGNTHQASSVVSPRTVLPTDADDNVFDDDFDSFVSPEPANNSLPDFRRIASGNKNPYLIGTHHALDADALPPVTQGAEVLFDASAEAKAEAKLEEKDDDDEWGTFETAHSALSGQLLDIEDDGRPSITPVQTTSDRVDSNASALVDLLSLEDPSPYQSVTSKPKLNPRHPQSLKESNVKQKPPSQNHRSLNRSEDDFFGEWDEFEDGAAEQPQPPFLAESPQSQATISTATESLKVSDNRSFTGPRNTTQLRSVVRPTNIPPPSVLLQVFPPMLDNFREQLLNSKRESTAFTSGLASDLCNTLKVASRIVAGRALRWKRDIRLSQSMKIGPAQFGKSSGMKLSSVSRAESIKEEQEAVGFIEAWRHHASAFSSILQSCGERPVPIISDKIRIGSATAEQGALKASHACALCGLKRDERLPKVDDDAQDSFGDWWFEHWGHTDCKWFWEEHSDKLHRR